jgi:hypothetical protein
MRRPTVVIAGVMAIVERSFFFWFGEIKKMNGFL